MDVGQKCSNYGGLFVGEHAAEVLGDYGAGPNHTLPTGGTGKYTGGLSVFNFLRIRTYMRIDDPASPQAQAMVDDSIIMARLEGLEGHARAAETRSVTQTPQFKKWSERKWNEKQPTSWKRQVSTFTKSEYPRLKKKTRKVKKRTNNNCTGTN